MRPVASGRADVGCGMSNLRPHTPRLLSAQRRSLRERHATVAISAAPLVEVRKDAEPRGRPRDEGPRMRMKGATAGVWFPRVVGISHDALAAQEVEV